MFFLTTYHMDKYDITLTFTNYHLSDFVSLILTKISWTLDKLYYLSGSQLYGEQQDMKYVIVPHTGIKLFRIKLFSVNIDKYFKT